MSNGGQVVNTGAHYTREPTIAPDTCLENHLSFNAGAQLITMIVSSDKRKDNKSCIGNGDMPIDAR